VRACVWATETRPFRSAAGLGVRGVMRVCGWDAEAGVWAEQADHAERGSPSPSPSRAATAHLSPAVRAGRGS
jgi:hypothetical protein